MAIIEDRADEAPQLDRPIQQHLGEHLRKAYVAVTAEAIPERFAALIRELERALVLRGRKVNAELRNGLLSALPSLRAFAISLCGDQTRADDLVQDTIMRAWANLDRFELGTNLNAWLFTILRNLFHSDYRKKKREVEDADGAFAATLTTAPDQHARLDLQDFRTALAKLAPDQREALLLVGAEGLSYEEAANICGVAVGTIKSRVNRARTRLAQLMHHEDEEDFGPDRVLKAALAA